LRLEIVIVNLLENALAGILNPEKKLMEARLDAFGGAVFAKLVKQFAHPF